MAYSLISNIDTAYKTITYSGNSTAGRQITDVGFAPDFVWYKCRSHNEHNRFVNSTEADAQSQIINTTGAMGSDPQGITGFLSNGYTVGSTDHSNATGKTYFAHNWLLGGTAPTKTYKVVVVSDSGNKYRFRNSADDTTFGASAVTLDLQEGGTYTFDVSDSTMNSHPFVIGTAANSSEYSTGVTYKLDGVTKTYSQYTSGFSAATSRQLIITVASGAPALYYWCSVHSGMGGAINTNTTHGSSNFDGNVQSLVTANTNLGISLVRYSGNGSNSATIGHGLGTKLDLVITKDRDGVEGWHSHFEKLADGENYRLNEDHGQYSKDSQFSYGVVDCNESNSHTFKFLGTGSNVNNVNESSRTYTAICFSNRVGSLRCSEYIGNGNADGTFIYTGFKPKFVIFKRNASESWICVNDATGSNNAFPYTTSDGNAAETGTLPYEFLSNGIKMRGTTQNESSAEYHFIAIGQTMVGSNNVPATAS